MSYKLDKLYSLFTTRPKEMTAWEKEDWTDEESKHVRRGYYIPKKGIFCRVLNQDGSLCKNAQKFKSNNLFGHYRTVHVAEYLELPPRTHNITEGEAERARKEFEKQVLKVLRANNINENGTLEELTDMIENYELREKKLGSKKATQVEQSYDACEANEHHDSALSSMERPRDYVSSTASGKNNEGTKSIVAIGKATETQPEVQRIVSRKRAMSDTAREGIEKRVKTEKRTPLPAGKVIRNDS
ncbi:hypothetical protein BOTCAL_0313g00060 [Botryotinia calthae]|uniref:Uncharacterized protein n=1 Tax=Botryotinia calthae TaxID=38488 RepID=A0A4Y8CTY6_9HELO|nr:hypothetical protein BOTCAL_0313g00060 [Botryotinia calthae]